MLVLSIEDGIGDSVKMADNSCLYNLETDRIFCSQLVYVYSLSQLLRELHLQKHLFFFLAFLVTGNVRQCFTLFRSPSSCTPTGFELRRAPPKRSSLSSKRTFSSTSCSRARWPRRQPSKWNQRYDRSWYCETRHKWETVEEFRSAKKKQKENCESPE